jgi:putative phosphoribosyl transferase
LNFSDAERKFFMIFASRQDAGRRLAHRLLEQGITGDVAVGLPRGGVVVAAEISLALHIPLEVVVVRKIGHPMQREFAVGAISENGVHIIDEHSIGSYPGVRASLQSILAEEQQRLKEYQQQLHPYGQPDLRDKKILLVDDGLATGSTMEAAALAMHKAGASKIIIAVPVASTTAADRLRRVADEIFAVLIDPDFRAVGAYYESFDQTSTEEVLELLAAAHSHPARG